MIISVPFSFTDATKGCGASADKIINEVKNIKVNEQGVLLRPVFEKLDSVDKVGEHSKTVLQKSGPHIFVGGDHYITYHIVKEFAKRFQHPAIVIFDAHPDCSVAHSLLGQKDLVLALVGEKIIAPENILIVGLRSWSESEYHFLHASGVRFYTMNEISVDGIMEVCDAVMAAAKDADGLYISVDMDVVDPAFAPGVSAAETGGLTGRELVYFLQRLRRLKNFTAADVVEVDAEKDDGRTVKLAAKVVGELM